MNVRFATNPEIAHWNDLILSNPDGGNIFASKEFAEQKELGGYKARYIMAGDLAITVLEKRTVLGPLWYLPKGPGVTSSKALFDVLKPLKTFALRSGAFALRIESELDRTQGATLARHGLKTALPIIPNPSTILLDISRELDDVLMALPQKGRHAIRRAERDGVTVQQVAATDENCQLMYVLLSETAEGQFGIRSYDYYKSFWQRFEASQFGQLFFAYFEGQVVAGAYAMVYGTKSTYKDGASVRKRTAYGASHLLQWHVISWAKSMGAEIHDFCGSPPSDEVDNPEHRHYGIGLFKLAFNKTVTDYIGCYDAVLKPTAYLLWTRLIEKIYRRIHTIRHHDSYY